MIGVMHAEKISYGKSIVSVPMVNVMNCEQWEFCKLIKRNRVEGCYDQKSIQQYFTHYLQCEKLIKYFGYHLLAKLTQLAASGKYH